MKKLQGGQTNTGWKKRSTAVLSEEDWASYHMLRLKYFLVMVTDFPLNAFADTFADAGMARVSFKKHTQKLDPVQVVAPKRRYSRLKKHLQHSPLHE